MAMPRIAGADPSSVSLTLHSQPTPSPLAPPPPKEHLLRVAAAVSRDAAMVWQDLRDEIERHVAAHGQDGSTGRAGFHPSGGWKEFLDRFDELRLYIDGIERICTRQV